MARTIWHILIGVLLIPTAVLAQSPSAEQLDELYRKSGLAALVEEIPAGVQAGFDKAFGGGQGAPLTARQLKMIHTRIPQAYAPDDIRPGIIAVLADKLNAEDVKVALVWLGSPLGQKCTAMETAAAAPEAMAAMEAYAAELQPSPERVALLGELAQAVKAAENAVEVVMNTQLAIAVGMMAALPEQQRQPIDVIRNQIEQVRPQVRAAMENQTVLAFLYTYRELTADEIRQYLRFARSDVGMRYHAAASEGIEQALTAGSLKLGAMISEVIQATEGQSEI